MAHQQESFLPFSSRQSLSCCLSHVARRSTPKPRGPLYSPSEPCGPFPHFRTAWSSSFPLRTSWYSPLLLQNHMDLYLSACSRTSWFSHLLQSHVVYSFLPQNLVVLPIYFGAAWSPLTLWLPGLGLNPSSHLPLQPISDSSYSQLHLPASLYSSSFTGLP